MTEAKIIIPNKEWLVVNNRSKLGTISKEKRGYKFFRKGNFLNFKSLDDIKEKLGIITFEENTKKNNASRKDFFLIYDYPCNHKPYKPVYNLRKRVALFSKSNKSKSQFCAGYFVIKFRKGWVKSFCPKFITIERYDYYGPFKTEEEMKAQLARINNEIDQHSTY